jgi:hypothetical protein
MRYLRQPPSPEEQQERTNQWSDYWEKKRLDDLRVGHLETTPAQSSISQLDYRLALHGLLGRTGPQVDYIKRKFNHESSHLLHEQAKQLRDIWQDYDDNIQL